jgi:carboxypeptidase Q
MKNLADYSVAVILPKRRMKRHPVRILFLFIFISTAQSQQAALDQWDTKIIAEGMERSQVMQNLEYLCDMIGPRLTGSEQLKRANEWTAERFKEYGLKNVNLEPWKLPRTWRRGLATAWMVKPYRFQLTVAQKAWTDATNGAREGRVVQFKINGVQDLGKYVGKIRGAWLLVGEPAKIPAVPSEERRLRRVEREPEVPQPPDTAAERWNALRRSLRDTLNMFWHSEGIAGLIQDAAKPHGLLTMTGSPGNYGGMFGGGSSPDLNTEVFMVHEHYALLHRLLARGEDVRVGMNLESYTTDGPVDVYNTVAEIPGSERPDEVVVLAGHLDSWDLGQGTTDDGTGCMAVLEAARILRAVDAKPKRTIRFILFSGEEQGHFGSRAYVAARKDELSKVSACIVLDLGTGKIRGIALQGNEAAKPVVDSLLAPFHSMGVFDISLRHLGGSDHMSYEREGVPGFFFLQDGIEYGLTHHSQSDTFDHASEEDLKQASVVMAAFALRVANLPDLLPRKVSQPTSGAR